MNFFVKPALDFFAKPALNFASTTAAFFIGAATFSNENEETSQFNCLLFAASMTLLLSALKHAMPKLSREPSLTDIVAFGKNSIPLLFAAANFTIAAAATSQNGIISFLAPNSSSPEIYRVSIGESLLNALAGTNFTFGNQSCRISDNATFLSCAAESCGKEIVFPTLPMPENFSILASHATDICQWSLAVANKSINGIGIWLGKCLLDSFSPVFNNICSDEEDIFLHDFFFKLFKFVVGGGISICVGFPIILYIKHCIQKKASEESYRPIEENYRQSIREAPHFATITLRPDGRATIAFPSDISPYGSFDHDSSSQQEADADISPREQETVALDSAQAPLLKPSAPTIKEVFSSDFFKSGAKGNEAKDERTVEESKSVCHDRNEEVDADEPGACPVHKTP